MRVVTNLRGLKHHDREQPLDRPAAEVAGVACFVCPDDAPLGSAEEESDDDEEGAERHTHPAGRWSRNSNWDAF